MKILFLGSIHDIENNKLMSGTSVAGNLMQVNILKTLLSLGYEIEVLSVPSVAAFPKEKKIYFRKFYENISRITINQINFINIPLIKQLNQSISLYKAAKNIVIKGKIDLLICFNLYPQIGNPAMKIQKKFKIKTIAVLADLPIDDNNQRSWFMKKIYSLFNLVTINNINKTHNFILLNEGAINTFNIKGKYILVEGGIDENQYIQTHNLYEYKKRNIVYTGALTEYSGIIELILAFEMLDENDLSLNIYGKGPLEDKIIDMITSKKNITYHGFVDQITARLVQREAYILANTRPIHDKINQVTFPSKIYEYMLSGTVILSTKLKGFSNEFEELIYFVNDSNPIEIAAKIKEILEVPLEDLDLKALKAKEFVLKNKTWKVQSTKIKKFIDEIIN